MNLLGAKIIVKSLRFWQRRDGYFECDKLMG